MHFSLPKVLLFLLATHGVSFAFPLNLDFSDGLASSLSSIFVLSERMVGFLNEALPKRDDPAILSTGQTCRTGPIDSDCSFDILQDIEIGLIDATMYSEFDQLYASTANALLVDDTSALSGDGDGGGAHCPRGKSCKRQTAAPMSLYEEVLLRFQKSETQITAAVNQAYNSNTSTLIYGYNDTGPTPSSGYTICSPLIDPWTWCDSSGQPVPRNATESSLPSSSPTAAGSVSTSQYTACNLSSAASCPNSTFGAIDAIQGTAVLHHAEDGNIYSFSETNFQPSNNLTLSAQLAGNVPFMIADAKGRLLHTYNDTMSAWGVGRLRLSKPENMPITSLPVALVPAAHPLNPSSAAQAQSVVTAVDTSARLYYLITCNYSDAYSKIFLATDLVNGTRKLLDSTILGNVTGEAPMGCQTFGYSNGDGPL